jgi:Na+(H+)/acetate symporter ActP
MQLIPENNLSKTDVTAAIIVGLIVALVIVFVAYPIWLHWKEVVIHYWFG